MPIGSATKPKIDHDPAIKSALDIIYGDYSDIVSVDAKKKQLRKWGTNESVGTSGAVIMTLGSGETFNKPNKRMSGTGS